MVDIDLDFWVRPPRGAATPGTRGCPSGQVRTEPSPSRIREVLEAKGYSPLPRTQAVVSHEGVLEIWRTLSLRTGRRLDVVHIDAHHDCYRIGNSYEPECGNFIRAASECRMLHSVTWVVPEGAMDEAAVQIYLSNNRRMPKALPNARGFTDTMAGVRWSIVEIASITPLIGQVPAALTVALSPEWIDSTLFAPLAEEAAAAFGLDQPIYRKALAYPEQTSTQARFAEHELKNLRISPEEERRIEADVARAMASQA